MAALLQSLRTSYPNPLNSRAALTAVLLVGLLHGLVYVFITPPWQHNDEPGHFEYAWLVANRLEIPERGDYDALMRRETLASMVEHDFFKGGSFPSLLETPAWIGVTQTGDKPLYYLWAGLPLVIAQGLDVAVQLQLARIASTMLVIPALLGAYGLAAQFRPEGSALPLLSALSLALLPGFTKLMASVNNDAGAAAVFALFLWAAAVLARKGISLQRLFTLVFLTVAAWFTKSTAGAPALAITPLALVFSVLPASAANRKALWALWLSVPALLVLLTFGWSDPAHWVRLMGQDGGARVPNERAVVGENTLLLEGLPAGGKAVFFQPIPGADTAKLRGQTVTIGFWVWGENETQASIPVFSHSQPASSPQVDIGLQPAFHAYTTTIASDAPRLTLWLNGPDQPRARVYYDAVTVAMGKQPTDIPPEYDTEAAESGVWEGVHFENFVRNSSFEGGWPHVRRQSENILQGLLPFHPALLPGALLESESFGWYYRAAGTHIHETFWARFGWGEVPLRGGRFLYPVLAVVGLAGGAVGAWALWNASSARKLWVLLVLTLSLVWGAALLRGAESLYGSIFIPGARYASPAFAPTMVLLNAGWLFLWQMLRRRLPLKGIWGTVGIALWLAGFLLLSTLGVSTVLSAWG